MAFPTIVGTPTESATTAVGTSHVVNLPSGATGNLFLLIMNKGSAAGTINALTGWNELIDQNSSWSTFVAWRRCDGTEGTTTTFTSTASFKSATIVYEITGDNLGIAPTLGTEGAGTSQAPDPGNCDPAAGTKDYLWITFFILDAAGEEADDDTWCNNAATNYSNLVQKTAGTAGTNIGALVASCDRTNAASSEDAVWPAATTDASIGWKAFTIAVHPAASIDANTGSFTETGVAADLRVGRALSGGAATGSYALTGVAATLVVEGAGVNLTADPGSYSESGVAATLQIARTLAGGAVPGAYAETGVAATLAAGRALNGGAVPGVYSHTGFAATLVVDVPGAFSIIADPGAFTLTGVAATLLVTPAGGGGTADTITGHIYNKFLSGYFDSQGY